MSKAEDSIVKRMVDATNETVRLRAQLAVFVARDTVEAENIELRAENKRLHAALDQAINDHIEPLSSDNKRLRAALERAELSCTQARIVNGIGKKTKARQIEFLLGSFEQLAKEARAALSGDASC